MELTVLGSSSSGNCYCLSLNRKKLPPVHIMMEAGLPYHEIVKRSSHAGIDLNEIQAVLITHGHGDHCKSVKDLHKRRKKVYANEHVINNYGLDRDNILKNNEIRIIAANTYVLPFDVEHDAPGSLGFIIKTECETILFVNDCKYFKKDLSLFRFDYIFIESNYDGQVLHFAYENAKENDDKQNIVRYERLFNSHMSLSNCIRHLKKLDLSKCKAIFLMHLSDRHANENKFKSEVKKATGINTFVCKKNGGIL